MSVWEVTGYEPTKLIGQGSFGIVTLAARTRQNGNITKLTGSKKSLQKDDIVVFKVIHKEKLRLLPGKHSATTELRVLKTASNHPFIVGFKGACQSNSRIYIGLEYCAGGDLFSLLRDVVVVDSYAIRFYAMEIGLALQHLHDLNILYRDLKPENVAIAADGHIRLIDFGLSAILDPVTDTICPDTGRLGILTHSGTLAYSAPEVLRRQFHGPEIDWWGFGVLLYEMAFGDLPWWDRDPTVVCSMICSQPLRQPDESNPLCFDLVQKLLEKSSNHRLGYAKGFEEINSHPFLSDFEAKKMVSKHYRPPYSRVTNGPFDVSNFSPEFTAQSTTKFMMEEDFTYDSHKPKYDIFPLPGYTSVH
mmetsp:Transcript_5920/g.9225  ORF Transcript_5920/g.9225 Transcript_5920/m.9225 type:complete len:361 (+) Transcript_5920:3181-4263(+)